MAIGQVKHPWLLWLGFAVAICVPPLVSGFFALISSTSLVGLWVVLNVSPKRLVCSFFFGTLEIFFREMGVRNQFKVPPENVPTLFICAPHSSQFIDPFVVQYAVGRLDLCFLTAAKSMRTKFVGLMARLTDAIPVERAQDVSSKGEGSVWLSRGDSVTVIGRGTSFTRQLRVGDNIAVDGSELGLTVRSIHSDESLTLKKPYEPREEGVDAFAEGEWCGYRVLPHVDQAKMFEKVVEALQQGKAIGIFPEGGSHDRPTLLPLRAGVALMALEALSKYPSMPLRLVPVGLNYFSGHRFRSRVFVDIGEPMVVPAHLRPLYLEGGESKRRATNELMGLVNASLSTLTISAPDYDTLEFFWTLRRLAKTSAGPLDLDEQTELARRFSLGYERVMGDGRKWKDTERVQLVQSLSSEYNARLKSLGLRDYQVAHVMTQHMSRLKAVGLLLYRACFLVLSLVLWLPMTLLWVPFVLIARAFSDWKAREAVATSKVKILGRDVLATWKLLISCLLFPLFWAAYTFVSGVAAERLLGLGIFWQRETMLITFFCLPLLTFAYIRGSEMILAVAKSLTPLVMVLLRPDFANDLTEQREALRGAMRDLLDELPSHDSKGEGEEATSSTPLAAAFPQSQWGKQWVQWRTERWTKEHMSTSTPDSPETPSKRAPPPASSAPPAAAAIALPESVAAESVAAASAASAEWRLDVDEAESKDK